jgi:hypothetical protein
VFSEMEYPHWMMVAGACLVVAGFIGLGISWYMNRAPAEDNLQPAAAPNRSVEEEEMSARHSSGELWKPADDDRLRALSALGPPVSSSEIGRLLHRSPSAVRKRASLLGITVQD